MPLKIKESKTFKGKFELRKPSGRLFATDLTEKEAENVKRLSSKFERCVKKVKKQRRAKAPHAVCRKAIFGKGKKRRKRK